MHGSTCWLVGYISFGGCMDTSKYVETIGFMHWNDFSQVETWFIHNYRFQGHVGREHHTACRGSSCSATLFGRCCLARKYGAVYLSVCVCTYVNVHACVHWYESLRLAGAHRHAHTQLNTHSHALISRRSNLATFWKFFRLECAHTQSHQHASVLKHQHTPG